MANDVAGIVNAEGGRRRSRSCERHHRAVRWQEEGGPVLCADHIAGAIDSECHRSRTYVDVQNGERSVHIANEVGEVTGVIQPESDGAPVIRDAVHIGAGSGVGATTWTVEIGEVVYGSRLRDIRQESHPAADFEGSFREPKYLAHVVD